VQGRYPDLRILLMSGYSAELLGADSAMSLRWELLRKPYSREGLARAIARVFAAGRGAAQAQRPEA
jgi:hypothetical protein